MIKEALKGGEQMNDIIVRLARRDELERVNKM